LVEQPKHHLAAHHTKSNKSEISHENSPPSTNTATASATQIHSARDANLPELESNALSWLPGLLPHPGAPLLPKSSCGDTARGLDRRRRGKSPYAVHEAGRRWNRSGKG